MADIKYVVQVDDQGGIKKLQNLDQVLDDLQGTSRKTDTAFSSLWQQFALGQVAVNAAYKAFGFLKSTLTDSISEAADYEKAFKGLDAAFAISGRTMPGMTDHLKRYADAMMNLGLADDSAVLKAESLTMQLTQLDEAGIKAVTRGAIGLSAVFGMDLQSAVEMLSRGMEGQFYALNRLFPAIRNATGEGEKHAALMKIMNDLYARAVVDTGTYAGKVKQLGIEWAETKKTIGEQILNTGILQAGMHQLTVVMERISGTSPAIREATAAYREWQVLQGQLYASLLKLGGPLGIVDDWVKKLAKDYGFSYDELLKWVREGGASLEEFNAMTAVLRAHNVVVGQTTVGYSETGKALRGWMDDLADMIRAVEKSKKVAFLDESWATTLTETPLGQPKNQFLLGDQLLEQQSKIKAFASLFAVDVQGISNTNKDLMRNFSKAADEMAAGFANAFETFKFTAKGFGDFFIKLWISIRDAFFRILAEIVAKWLIVHTIFAGLSLIFPGATPVFDAVSSSWGMAKGFEGVVSRPTPMLVGEAGPEYVSVTPLRGGAKGGGGGTTNVYFTIHAIDGANVEAVTRQRIVPILKEVYAHGGL